MRKTLAIILGISLAGIMVAILSVYLLKPVPAQPMQNPEAPPVQTEVPFVPVLPPAEMDELGMEVPAENLTEQTVVESAPPLPPPTVDLSGNIFDSQRVPGTAEIGQIQKIFFHEPSNTLFMAVVEPDKMRTFWKLSGDVGLQRVFVVNREQGDMNIEGDGRGRIYFQHDTPSRLYRSNDGFKTWRLVLKDTGMFWQIANDGAGTLYGALHATNQAILYRSTDDGLTWAPWKDFQKIFPGFAVPYDPVTDKRFALRHLHGVIYDPQTQAIMVGTGDIARFALRSIDNGETWTKIWDEGFTASAAMTGGNRYLLGPDQLRGHGIALYDAAAGQTRQVWDPKPYGYAGYVYSILNNNGIYYAGIHTERNDVPTVFSRFGIIVSPDGENWYPFLEWGPYGAHERTNIWLTATSDNIYASINGALYAFQPLDQAWFADKTPFK